MSRLLALLAIAALGCASFPPFPAPVPVATNAPPNAASSWRVSVEEFALATEVMRYDGPPQWIGVELAQQIVAHLRRAGVHAEISSLGAPSDADLVIRGRIVAADGGSKGKRIMVGMGAGGANLRIEGEAVRSEGSVIGSFALKRRSARAVDSVVLMEACTNTLGHDVAIMVTTNTYRTE